MPKKGFPVEKDISNNSYKVGDRIFCEVYNFNENHELVCTGIATNIITGIRKSSYEDDTTRENYRDTGTIVHHNMFDLMGNTAIEDYNCLPYDDPRVVEFCKTHTLCGPELIDEIRKFLTDHGAFHGDTVVSNILYYLADEYEKPVQ